MKKATRQSFSEQLAELGASDTDIVVLDADLAKSTGSLAFGKKFPDRFFEMGIQEQNMLGIAAGLALMGKKPFACSFSTFIVGRFETVRMSVAYTNANVKIVGTHCGVGIGEDGYSQMALEDIALIRTLPSMAIIQPADDRETKAAVSFLASYQHPAFLRLTRQGLEQVHDDQYTFQFGKADLLKSGTDATVFTTGGVAYHSLKAAELLEAEGCNVRVYNVHTIKPLDVETVVHAARETGSIISVEDHSIIGGLGGAIAEVLAERLPTRMLRIGMHGFGESGSPEALYRKFELDTEGQLRQMKQFLLH